MPCRFYAAKPCALTSSRTFSILATRESRSTRVESARVALGSEHSDQALGMYIDEVSDVFVTACRFDIGPQRGLGFV